MTSCAFMGVEGREILPEDPYILERSREEPLEWNGTFILAHRQSPTALKSEINQVQSLYAVTTDCIYIPDFGAIEHVRDSIVHAELLSSIFKLPCTCKTRAVVPLRSTTLVVHTFNHLPNQFTVSATLSVHQRRVIGSGSAELYHGP